MKRRCAALLLCACLCAGALTPALAAEGPPADNASGVSWEELEERIRTGNHVSQAMGENIATLQAMDYDVLKERLADQLSALSDASWYSSMKTIPVYDPASGTLVNADNPMYNTYNAGSASAAYKSLREQFDAIKDGDLAADNADLVRQLENGLDQLVGGGQTLYLTILELEQTLSDAQRGVAAIDRSLTELRLRKELGQVSQQQVDSLERTRADTVSQLATLENGITSCKAQLQTLMGETPTGALTLAPLPQDGEWTEPDYAADLDAAKEASWTLYSAKATLDDAEETWRDDRKTSWNYAKEMADHTWAAAQATYAGTVADFETAFKALCDAQEDAKQVWENKSAQVLYQQVLVTIAQLRYDRGLISRNALLSAQDDLAAARSAQQGAWRDLFSARNNYRRAVEKGIV